MKSIKGYEAAQYWSSRFIKELQAIDCSSEELKTTLGLYIKDYRQTKTLLLEATRTIRKLCKQPDKVKRLACRQSAKRKKFLNN